MNKNKLTNSTNVEKKKSFFGHIWFFLNTPFMSWFGPSVVIGLFLFGGFSFYKDINLKKMEEEKLIREINTRLKFSKIFNEKCYEKIQKNENESIASDYKILMDNLFIEYPNVDNLDSLDYQKEFRDKNMFQLIKELSIYNKDKNIKELIAKLENYLLKLRRYHKIREKCDSGSYYFNVYLTVKDTIKLIKY